MGSFAFTCCVSSLPIEAGDKVRYFLVAESPYKDQKIQPYATSLWWPRTFPLQASYNEYGSVENIQHPQLQQLWLDSFKLDMVERGTDQTFEELLEAAWEGRILIRQDMPIFPEEDLTKYLGKDPVPETAVGIPTIRRVQDLIGEGFFVDDEEGFGKIRVRVVGKIRVRVEGYKEYTEEVKLLEAVQGKLKDYATAIVADEHSCSVHSGAQLLVRPRPGVERFHAKYDDKTPLKVRQAMIREDVWQSLLGTEVHGRWGDLYLYYPSYREKRLKRGAGIDTLPQDKDPIPFTVGVSTMTRMARKRDWDAATSEALLKTVMEFSYIHVILDTVRYQWRPSFSSGPQSGEWLAHEQLLSRWSDIAFAEYEKASGYEDDE